MKMNFSTFIGSLKSSDYYQLITQGLEFTEFDKLVSPNTRIFIKPNLTYPIYKQGVMTNPKAIEAAIMAVREYTHNIYIGDSDSGGYNRFSMDEVYKETGIADFADKYNVEVVNLSKVKRKTIQFQYKAKSFSLELPCLLTDEIDFLITMPVPKIHNNTGVSLTFKNQWGCIPENKDRLRLHPYFKHVILEVNKAVKAKMAIIDGKYGLNINGPMKGIPVELDWLLVTNDIGAGARICCELMQIPLTKIAHLRYAQNLGFIPELKDIQLNQDIRPYIIERFILQRKWTDYPGLLAFHHPFLAYIAYFSPLAKILHKLLYIFREPLYDYHF